MKNIILAFILGCVLCGCSVNLFPLKNSSSELIEGVDIQEPLHETLSGTGNSYYPIFETGGGTKVLSILHSSGIPTKVAFINSEAKHLAIKVQYPSASGGNLRLSQIIAPDGTIEGPFGQDGEYALSQFGGYEFIFTENIMAGDAWSGNAQITMTLTK